MVWVAKAIERIGDHTKNIAEHVIFIAAGADVRHASPEEVARMIAQA
jgi:phosphate transport system protein